MAGWFELSKSSDNQFRFVLKAGNGETILTSELYTSKASAEKGIASVLSYQPTKRSPLFVGAAGTVISSPASASICATGVPPFVTKVIV